MMIPDVYVHSFISLIWQREETDRRGILNRLHLHLLRSGMEQHIIALLTGTPSLLVFKLERKWC